MAQQIESKIIIIKGQRVILDSDLAELYGVSTKRLNEQVSRNIERFPPDFMFQLNNQELSDLRSQIATSKEGRGGRRYKPRVFVRLKEIAHEHSDLKRRLQALEQKVAKGFADHEEELQEIRFLITKFDETPQPKKRKIGF